MKEEQRKFILATSTLAGTTIGVGFFSLPLIASQTGLMVMLGYFLALGGLVLLIHLVFGQVALATPDFLRLPGYAKIHLGEKGKKIALAAMILGTYGSLLAYLIIGGKFLAELNLPFINNNSFWGAILYFAIGSILIYLGINPIAKLDLWSLVVMVVIFMITFLSGVKNFKISHLFLGTDLSKFFLPYGPILFSLWGVTMIPEIEEMLGKGKEMLKKTITVSFLFTCLIYVLFVLLILGISGPKTSVDAISGLKGFVSQKVIALVLALGLMTTFTSFVALGLTIRKVFSYDFKMNYHLAFVLSVGAPLIMFVLGFQDFLKTISLVGGVMLGVEGILILLMYKKIRPEKNIIVYSLASVLLGGVFYEIISFLK